MKSDESIQLKYISLIVDDQDKALNFYTSILGFNKVADVPVGDFRWLSVESPYGAPGVELLLEPAAFPFVKNYQKSLYDAKIPATAFITKNVDAVYRRLKSLNVIFIKEPTEAGNVKLIMFEDGCGNVIQLMQVLELKSRP